VIRPRFLNDKKNEAYLISLEKHMKLVKVGQLRQSCTPVPGKAYWRFPTPLVELSQDRVDIEIGQFHVQGLLVQ